MKTIIPAITVLLSLMMSSVGIAAPMFTNVSTVNVGANMATLKLRIDEDATGYFTLLTGINPDCGISSQIKAGKTAADAVAPYFGSLSLSAFTDGYYTVRNLTGSTGYTACLTADNSNGQAAVMSDGFTTIAATALTIPGWNPLGSAMFSSGSAHFTSLAFAPDGTPYVAYVNANNNYKISVMKYSSNWGLVGLADFASSTANPASLAFSPDGTPYVAYIDGSDSMVMVKKYSGGDWINVGPTASFADTDSTSLAFDPAGNPYVAYIDASNSKAAVIKYSTGVWSVLGGSGLSSSGAWSTSLAIAPDGTPYIAYSDYGNSGKATVMKYSDGSWTRVGSSDVSLSVANSTSLAIAPDGSLYLAYQDGGNGYKATVMKFTGGAWTPVVNTGFTAGTATNTSLAIAPDGAPCVAFQDGANSARATVMKYTGSAWIPVGSAGFSAGTANSTSLAFAPDGLPYVAYGDEGNGSRATVMKLNNFPTISGSPPATVLVDTAYSFTPTANEYTTGFTIVNEPSWASFDPANGNLSGTPATTGTYSNIIITAINDYGSATLPTFSITVNGTAQSGSVKIGSNIHSNIATALAAAINGDALKILATITPEGVNYSGSGVLTLEGGYDAGWNRQLDIFSPVSGLTIMSGTLIVDQIVVK